MVPAVERFQVLRTAGVYDTTGTQRRNMAHSHLEFYAKNPRPGTC
jgi:hypothetical protein